MAKPSDSLMYASFATVAMLLTGCSSPDRPVFDPVNPAITWPAAPHSPRIAYVGQISSSVDLKPGLNLFEGMMSAAFGRKDARGVLTPFAVCTDDADRLFVADTGGQVVHVFDLKSRRYAQWKPSGKTPFTQPVGVAWDPAGRLVVSDSVGGRLFVFSDSGRYLGEMGADLLTRPGGIVIEPGSRRIFVSDVGTHQVLVLTPEGQLISRIGRRGVEVGEFNYPTHLALDRRGYLYVTDSLNFRIQVFNTELQPVRSLGLPGDLPGYFGQPKGIALDSENHLYVVDARMEMVQIFDEEKRLLLYFGEEGNNPGQFWLPAGIHIDSRNRIWIADMYNKRVAVFDYLPEKQP